MTESLEEVSFGILQEQYLKELKARQRLQQELKITLAAEKNLRLENDFLRLHLRGKHPGRIKDVDRALQQLGIGADTANVFNDKQPLYRRIISRIRRAVGRMPGVRRLYHGIKKFTK